MALARADELHEIEEENENTILSAGKAENYYAIEHVIPPSVVSYNPNVHYGDVHNYYQTAVPSSSHDSETTTGSSLPSKEPTKNENIATFSDSNLLKEKLQSFYRNITLPPLIWLNQTKDLPVDQFYIDPELECHSSKIEKEDIFKEVDGRPPNRILIEAQSGYGKTSLATKLAYDWATRENYMTRFKFVFLIPLKELVKLNIESTIQDIAEISGFPFRRKTLEIINNNDDQTLFIFDGLTELSTFVRLEILQILYKHKYGDVKIIVTSKTCLFPLDETEKMKLFGECHTLNTFHDKRITLLGIKSPYAKRQLLSKLISNELLEQSLPMDKCSYLFDSPLFLYIIAFLLQSRDSIIDITTWSSTGDIVLAQTELFKQFFRFTIKQYAKQKISFYAYLIDGRLDLFNINGFHSPFVASIQPERTNLYEFGKLTFQHIGKHTTKFEDNELMQSMYAYGLVHRYEESNLFGTVYYYYEPHHSSIADFAAAYYIWVDIKLEDDFSKDCLECMVKYCSTICSEHVEITALPLFLSFLFGLIQDDAVKLFRLVYKEMCTEQVFTSQLLGTDPNNVFIKTIQFVKKVIRGEFTKL